ncbi:MAG: phosphoribosylformylglycinamidine cyclo-ligase [Thermosediminibacterales bacterium]|nr:phosphoribosylformylglycinamidine cyclo-ligase [Thermosediminibacterales bacterium]MDK2835320.1 phosphoribosylformylglycinamidine cyclo-ligase [Thermosediminibacterales bacterium]
MKKRLSYKDSGVDIDAGNRAVKLMHQHVRSTFRPEVITDIGGFGALFALDLKNLKNPVLVSGTDGVGTKLSIAFMMDKHDTVGQDCVAMCVNDILCSGAEPLFFLDYLATGKLVPEKAAEIIKGIAEGCRQAGCALIGGETAEMPGFYDEDEYDLAGFAVGIADRDKIIDGSTIKDSDVVVGISSSGLHSNGFSLVRKIFFHIENLKPETYIEELGKTLGEELLKPTRIYVRSVTGLFDKFNIKGIAHITGGGFFENLPRILPEGKAMVINKESWEPQPIFRLIQETGEIEEREMYRTFNMGIGMVLVVSPEETDGVLSHLKKQGENAVVIGEVKNGDREVLI